MNGTRTPTGGVFILLSDFVWPVRFVLAAFLVGLAAVLQLGLTLWTVLEPAERVARAAAGHGGGHAVG